MNAAVNPEEPADALITICIVHFRKLVKLKRTIAALEKQTHHPFQLKILNQGFLDDEIGAFLRALSRDAHVEVIFGEENIGCSRGRTLLAAGITTPFTMMLDDDIIVNEDWDVPALEKLTEERDIGAVGFCLHHDDGSLWCVGGRNVSRRGSVIRFDCPPDHLASSGESFVDVDFVLGGAMIYRTALSSKFTWDPEMFIAFEDFDLGIRLKDSGVRSIVSLRSQFIHESVSHDWRQRNYNRYRRDYHRIRASYLRLCQKHECRLDILRDTFYRYVCLLPNSVIRPFAYLWLNLRRVRRRRRHALAEVAPCESRTGG